MLYTKQTKTIREFRDSMYQKTDCLPVGQRLPCASKNDEKSKGIVRTIHEGIDIGSITVMELNREQRRASVYGKKYEFESIDGGHRKRALWSYLTDEFEVDGKYFSQLSEEEKDNFLDTELSFTVYDALDCPTKGHIFRTLNKTTDVNFMEMLNSYGDIPIANFIRETVRTVKQIDNDCHDLFKFSLNTKNQPNYNYLSFDNDRLKQDHALARIVYRYVKHPKDLLGGSSDTEIGEMYTEEDVTIPTAKIKEHLEFLRKMAIYRKQKFKSGLTQRDFKALSYFYFYLLDTYKAFNIKCDEFFDAYASASTVLLNKDGKYSKVIHEPSGYTVQIMYKKYIDAPWDGVKISTALSYLIGEMGDIDKIVQPLDTNRFFTKNEKEAKLAEQGFRCIIDGESLTLEQAEAAHIIAHAKGGRTIYSNLAMVRTCYNKEMGTMNLNDYKEKICV